jgi:hypothetical protein
LIVAEAGARKDLAAVRMFTALPAAPSAVLFVVIFTRTSDIVVPPE